MNAAGIVNYTLESTYSEVYGNTLDVMAGIEIGSSAMGPHLLDEQWGIVEPWVGIGFGLERLLMVKKGISNIQNLGKSLTHNKKLYNSLRLGQSYVNRLEKK